MSADSLAAILHNSSSTEVGTAANPLRVDPTATTTQPISATALPLPTGAALETGGNLATIAGKDFATQTTLAAIKAKTDNIPTDPAREGGNLSTLAGKDFATSTKQTDGTQKAICRGGAKGSTTAADVTSTAEGSDHQAVDVQIYHGGAAKDPTQIRALTSSDVVTAVQSVAANLSATVVQGTPANLRNQSSSESNAGSAVPTQASMVGGSDGTNLQALKATTAGNLIVRPLPTVSPSATSTTSTVAASASSVQLLAASTDRIGATVFNDSLAVMYLKLGTTASATDYTVQVMRYGYYEVPFGYQGRIDAIWSSATGNARITQLTLTT